MKRLNLGKLKFGAEEVLQRNQLAGIYGGSGGSGWDMVLCTCGSSGSATCTRDLAFDGTNRCCAVQYGPGVSQNCGR